MGWGGSGCFFLYLSSDTVPEQGGHFSLTLGSFKVADLKLAEFWRAAPCSVHGAEILGGSF